MAVSYAPSSSKRFLIFLSYIGHEFRGVQKQLPYFKNGEWIPINTVQNVLEDSLKFVLKPNHDVKIFSSSRTDAGVHCLRSSVHVDLTMHYDLHPNKVSSELNKHFLRENMGIRVLSTHSVPNWFSCRHDALSRTYLYRFACRKEPRPEREKHLDEIPFSEHRRALFLQNSDLDIEKMRKAANLLVGTKNFFCFMNKPSKKSPGLNTVRTIYSLTIKPGKPFMSEYDPPACLYNYWDVVCNGRSFLYRQVRRIVGVLLAVGRGAIDLDAVQNMIDYPVEESWDPGAICVPPWGLYLLDVEYSPLDFYDFDQSQNTDLRTTYALN